MHTTNNTAFIERIIIRYMKNLMPICLKINTNIYDISYIYLFIYSWKATQILSPEEIRILNFTLTSKNKPKRFVQNSLGPDGFTKKSYKCSREKYF